MKKYPGTTSMEITPHEIAAQAVARRAAAEGMVLLENDGVLPLSEGEKIVLYGGGASYTVKGGTGSGMVNNRSNVNITQGIRDAGLEILNEDWLASYDEEYKANYEAWKQKIYEIAGEPGNRAKLYDAHASNPMPMPKGSPIEKKDTETAIFVISRISGEGADRKAEPGDYYLSEDEYENLKTVTTLYEKTIVILNVGGIIDLSFLDELKVSVLVLMSIYFLFFKGKLSIRPGIRNGFLTGACGGVLNGLFSTGGPPIVLYLLGTTEGHAAYLATIQAYFAFNNVYATIIRFLNGQITAEMMPGLAGGFAGMILGVFFGGKMEKYIPDQMFLKLIYILMAFSGLMMLF